MGGEKLFKPFILLLSIISIFAIVTLALVTNLEMSAESVNTGSNQENLLFAIQAYDYVLYDPEVGIEVTPANVRDYMEYPKDADFIFTDGDDKKYVQIIRDNAAFEPTSDNMWEKYPNFISIQRQSGADIFRWHDKWNDAVIPFDAIIANFDRDTNTSIIQFDMSRNNDTVFVLFDDNTTGGLWTDNYTIYYGNSLLRDSKVDFWGTIRMITTAEVPGLNPRIQFFITFFWMFSYIFIGFTLASRIIPTLGGG